MRRSVNAHEEARERKKVRKPLQLRNEAQLNCVSLRSQLNCEVTCGAVKGQDERRCQGSRGTAPFGGALDSPASHHRTSMLTSENKIKEGRHVGLDFYDLLIEEALKNAIEGQ